MTTTLGRSRLGTGTVAGDFARAQPAVAITAPTGTISTTPFTVSWTFTSPVSRPQAYYRIRILSEDGAAVVYDSAIQVSGSTSVSLPVLLSSGSTYQVAVSAADLFDWSVEATSTIFFDGNTVDDIVPLDSVGTIYEVAINGVGYMLADHPDKEMRYERRVVPLDPQRLATGDTPFSEAIDRYTILSFIDWQDGAGQRFYRRSTSSPNSFYTSYGVNPFEPGEVRLLPATASYHASTYAFLAAVVAGQKLYLSTGSGQLSSYDDPSDTTATTFTITGAGTPVDLATDGTFWYFTDGSNVYRNSSAADPGSAWSTEDAQRIEWCTDRIVIAKKTGSSTVPNALATLNYSTGAVSGPGAGSTPFTFEEGTDIRSITSGDGYVWWAAARNDQSVIYSWKLGSTESYVSAFELPAGQDVQSIGFYQGNLFIRARELVDGSARKAIIYRAVPNAGKLTPTRVVDLTGTVDHSFGDFAGDDRFVYFSWRAMNTQSGIGCIDLSTGGWCRWLQAPSGTGLVRSIVQWYGRTLFTVEGTGAFLEQVSNGSNDNTVAEGSITTSIDDLNTAQRKGFTSVVAQFDPLPTGAEIAIEYSLDAGTSFTALTPVVSAAGQKTATWDIDEESDSIQFRITMNHTTTFTPVMRTLMVRAHAMGLADQVLMLPINCSDQATDLRNRPLVENGPGHGADRARALEALVQSRVKVQDVDWKTTGASYLYDLIAAETRSVGVQDRHVGRQSQSMVTMLTLRRSLR